MIYFIQEDGNPEAPIKIGFAAGKPADRLASLQTGYPAKLCLLACRDGGPADEAKEHSRWGGLRLHGEWFRSDPKLREYVARLTAQVVVAVDESPPLERRAKNGTTVPWRRMPLECRRCGSDLLLDDPVLANVEWSRAEDGAIQRVWWRHKLCHMAKEDGWEDLGDLCNPMVFIDFWMTTMNGLQTGAQRFSPDAYEDWKTLMLSLAERVFRPLTGDERERVKDLQDLPRAFGGLD